MDFYLFGLANKREKGLKMSTKEGENRGEGLKFQRGEGWQWQWQLAMFDLGIVGDQIISKLMVQAKPMIY